MRVAIVGFGVVGKSVLTFLASEQGSTYFNHLAGGRADVAVDLWVWNGNSFTPEEERCITDAGARSLTRDLVTLGEVVTMADWIIVSPGVNMNRYKQNSRKILCELDIFKHFFDQPTVGITGSLGKTTTTKLLGSLADRILVSGKGGAVARVMIGGNIGLGMLDLVQQRAMTAAAVLELSSFQLEFNKTWAPDVALWTNCFANHLDRHEIMAAYVDAKMNIIRHQRPDQVALLSASLVQGDLGVLVLPALATVKSQVYLVSTNSEDRTLMSLVPGGAVGFVTVRDGQVVIEQGNGDQTTTVHPICSLDVLPNVTFSENWLHVIGALYTMGIEARALGQWLKANKDTITIDNEHRCEFVATVRGVDFYNDSKATVIQSTEAAVRRLAQAGRPIVLILGGMGKGVDRSPLLESLKNIKNIKKIYCFGKECSVFASKATCYATLEEVMSDIASTMEPGDVVLLSPSGTSFDLYKNYEERGLAFKKLVAQLT